MILFAFDLLELDGEDYRSPPLLERKLGLRAILKRMQNGIYYTDHLDADGATMFEHACRFSCEGIVTKRVDQPYSSGRSKGWLKIKNPKSPAALRLEEGTF